MKSFKKLNLLIAESTSNQKNPKRILLGYGAYADLMANSRGFFEDVVGSAAEPNLRTFKKIRIKVTQDKNQIELEF